MTISTATRFLAMTCLSWLAAVAVSFLLIRLVPGDPVDVLINQTNVRASSDLIAAYHAQWSLDRSLVVQFVLWLQGFFTLDWGTSFGTGTPVIEELVSRLGWSAAIGFGGMGGALALGSGLGFYAAANPKGLANIVSRTLAVLGQALPAFAVGVFALWVFSVELRWVQPFSGGLLERLLLPIGLVVLFSAGSISRLVRVGFLETVESQYFRTARAKGLPHRTALWRHGRRRAAIGLLAGFAPDLAWIVGGTAVAEIVFGVPGLSERIIEAVAARDYPVLQAYVALIALWVVVGLQVCTALRKLLDPRIQQMDLSW